MAKKAYIGVSGKARKIKKGYIGVPQILPSEYTQIEHIEISGTQYINTKFIPNQDSRIVLGFALTDAEISTNNIVGTRATTSSAAFALSTINGNWRFGYNKSSPDTGVKADTERHIADVNKNVLSIDGEAIYTATAATFDGYSTVYIGAIHASSMYAGYVKVYSCKIYDANTLVRDYVPCVDSNDTAGMYDLVNGAFYTNAGSDTFIMGQPYSGGKARKIKKAYIGIGGVARPFWSGGELAYYGTITGLSVGRYRLAGASNPNYAIFAGGIQSSTYQSTVDAYNKSYTRQTATALAVARQHPAGGSIGNYAIIAGGLTSDSGTVVPHTNVEAYDLSLTKHTPSALSVARGHIAFASVGDYAIFAGGQHANSPYYTNVVNAYNSSLTRTNKKLSSSRRDAAGASVGSYALIAGGTGVYNGGGGSPIPSVEAFDASLTITSAPILKSSAYGLSGTRAGAYAVFGGGYGSAVTSNVTAYNASLTKSTPTVLSKARTRMATAALGSNGIFGGGGTSTISGLVATVDVYDENLTRTTPNELSSSRADLAAANIGDSALFAGGQNNKTNVDVFTII